MSSEAGKATWLSEIYFAVNLESMKEVKMKN